MDDDNLVKLQDINDKLIIEDAIIRAVSDTQYIISDPKHMKIEMKKHLGAKALLLAERDKLIEI